MHKQLTYSVQEAADVLGVGITTMKKLVRKEIPVVRIHQGVIRIRATDLEEWLAGLPADREPRTRETTTT